MPVEDVLLATVPYDLRQAEPLRAGAIGRLRSVTLITDGLALDAQRQLLSRCHDWISRYNEWYHMLIGITSGQGLHLLYDRELAITGDLIFESLPEVRQLGATARALGFAFSLSVTDICLRKHFGEIVSLAQDRVLTSLAISISDMDEDELSQSRLDAIENVVATGLNVGVIGDLATPSARALFRSQRLSGADLTWYPTGVKRARRGALMHDDGCHSRLRLYIESAGDIYPCYGLIGLTSGLLGNIDQPLEETGLGETPVLDLLDRWEAHGPELEGVIGLPDEEDPGLPRICALHRSTLL